MTDLFTFIFDTVLINLWLLNIPNIQKNGLDIVQYYPHPLFINQQEVWGCVDLLMVCKQVFFLRYPTFHSICSTILKRTFFLYFISRTFHCTMYADIGMPDLSFSRWLELDLFSLLHTHTLIESHIAVHRKTITFELFSRMPPVDVHKIHL